MPWIEMEWFIIQSFNIIHWVAIWQAVTRELEKQGIKQLLPPGAFIFVEKTDNKHISDGMHDIVRLQ